MKKAAAFLLAVLVLAALGLFCACEKEPEYTNPVASDPAYTTFVYEDFSFSYPVSCTDIGKEGYLLYCTAPESSERVFGVQTELSPVNTPEAIDGAVAAALCEKIIEETLPNYQAAAEKYGVNISREDFSYTVDSVEYIICGAEKAARIFYTVRFENKAFAPVAMSFCNVWVFDEEIVYLVTFCDVTGKSVQESFADCINYIFCD